MLFRSVWEFKGYVGENVTLCQDCEPLCLHTGQLELNQRVPTAAASDSSQICPKLRRKKRPAGPVEIASLRKGTPDGDLKPTGSRCN